MDKMEKAVHLIIEKKASYPMAARSCNVSIGSLQRAVKAFKEGREIGINGRPPSLEPMEQLILADELSHRVDIGENLTMENTRNIVSMKYIKISKEFMSILL